MTNPAYDIIDFTLNKKPEDVATTFADMANQAIADRLAAKKEEMQQAAFSDNSDPNDVEDVDLDNMSDEDIENFLSTLTPEELADLEKEIGLEDGE